MSRIGDVKGKFKNQVNPESDLSVINKVADEFSSHPVFSDYLKQKDFLENALKKATSEKETSLQAAGKLKTFAAQQKSLSLGNIVSLLKKQPENELYFNPGKLGLKVRSPSAYPVLGYPRFNYKYTHNFDRVKEGIEGADEAMAIYAAKKAEEANLDKALSEFTAQGPVMSVQDAQKLKQGTYKIIEKKYGQLGSAETEAQKSLARGLKEELEMAVPSVGPLNQKQRELIKTLKVADRQTLIDANKNMLGIAGLSTSPAQFLAMQSDRSALLKSLAARGIKAATPEGKNAAMVEALRRGLYKSAPIIATQE